MKCDICQKERLFKFLTLGHQPPSDAFLKPEDLANPEITYPIDVYFCRDCYLVQLGYAVNPEILFRDYVYTTSNNNSLKVNFKNLVDLLVRKFKLTANDLAIDVGSNDGTLLENYLPYKIKILGIDPSSASSIAVNRGIPTLVDFFGEHLVERIKQEYGVAKIITATNVFAHVVDLFSFIRGVAGILAQDGVFISESHHLLSLVNGMQYDSVYHEHLRYYSLKPLITLFEKVGMEIFDVEKISTHGGSIRVYAAKKGAHPAEPSVSYLVNEEEKAGLYKEDTFLTFTKHVKENKLLLYYLLAELKRNGKHIVGIGAPAKGNTLLNYCRLDGDIIDYLAERSKFKIGTFAPGSHIPVVDEERIFKDHPDYALLLAWNIADELMPKLRAAGFNGKFIIPNPLPRIV